MRRQLAKGLLLALSVMLVIAVPAMAYTYYASYTITESNGTAYSMLPIIEPSNNDWMADNDFMETDALDTRIQTLAGSIKPHMVAQDYTLTSVPVPADSQTNLYFTTGNTDLTSMDIITGYGGYETVQDVAVLEPTTDFEMEVDGYVLTGANDYLVDKTLSSTDEGVELYADGAGNVVGRIIDKTTGATDNILPNAAGDYTNIDLANPAVAHYLNVDDPVGVPDDAATIVYTSSVAQLKDAYNLETPTFLGDFDPVITDVTVFFRCESGQEDGFAQPFLRLGGVETTGTEVTIEVVSGWENNSESLGRPGGGSWTEADFADLQVAIGLRHSAGGGAPHVVECTQVYVIITYDYLTIEATTTAAGVTSGDRNIVLEQDDHDILALSNTGFETGDPPANWTLMGAGAAVARSNAQWVNGTYSGALTRNGADCNIYQDYAGVADVRGHTVTLGAWVYAAAATTTRIALADGTTLSFSDYHTGGSDWEWLTVSITESMTAVTLRSYLTVSTSDTTSYFDSVILLDASTASSVGANWLSGWDNRIRMDIDSSYIDADLTQFPLMVYLSSSSGINNEDVTAVFDEVGANSRKIQFTQDDGVTEMYCEIDYWDSGTEVACLWTSLANWIIDSDTDEAVFLYFDNDHADSAYTNITNTAAAEAVWDANFILVDHMKDDPDNAHTRDSTSNNNDGAKAAANEPVEAAGVFTPAQEFDKVNDEIVIAHAANQLLTTGGTLEALGDAYSYGENNRGRILDKSTGTAGENGYLFSHATSQRLQLNINNGGYVYSGTVPIGSFAHVSGRWDAAGTVTFTINGVVSGTPAASGNPVGITTLNALTTGNRSGVTDSTYDGLLDEVRVSNIERSTAWLKSTYYTLFDDLIDFIPKDSISMVEYVYDFSITVDSTLEDRVLGYSVPDTTNDWVLMSTATPYWNYYKYAVGGLDLLWYQPNDMVMGETYSTGTVTVTNGDATVVGAGGATWTTSMEGSVFVSADGVSYLVDTVTDATHLELDAVYGGGTLGGQSYTMNPCLPDRQGTAQNAGITWGSNPAGVTSVLSSLVSYAQPTLGQEAAETLDILGPAPVSDWFVEPAVTGSLLTNPLRPIVTILSDSTTLSETQAWVLFGVAGVLLATVLAAKYSHGHHILTGVACGAVIGLMVQQTVFPMYALSIVLVVIVAGVIAERKRSI